MKVFFAGASDVLQGVDEANLMLSFAYAKTQSKFFEMVRQERTEVRPDADNGNLGAIQQEVNNENEGNCVS